MATFSNQPIPDTAAPAASIRVTPSDSVVVLHFRSAPVSSYQRLNADLGLSLNEARFTRLQTYFSRMAKRDPTVAELRLLDQLDRAGQEHPTRRAVGELVTDSPLLAEVWADMMHRHGQLCGADTIRHAKSPLAAPPCTLPEALSLSARYLYRSRTRAPADCEEGRGGATAVLSTPGQEAAAIAEGYLPVARLDLGGSPLSVWERQGAPTETTPAKAGDFLLYLPRVSPTAMSALVAGERSKPHPGFADIRAITEKPFLLTLLELCHAADLYTARILDFLKSNEPADRIPTELLCATPVLKSDGTADYLLRVPVKRLRDLTDAIKEHRISAVVCGQVRANDRTVIYVRNDTGKQDIPTVDLPSAYIRAMRPVYLHRYTPQLHSAPPPAAAPVRPVRLPSPVTAENGLAPDGTEAVALTLPEGEILRLPDAELLLCSASVAVIDSGRGFAAAYTAAARVSERLTALGADLTRIALAVRLTAKDPAVLLRDVTPEVICGLHRLSMERGIPADDPAIAVDPATASELTLTVTAWTRDRKLCAELSPLVDRQWKPSGRPVGKESPLYLLPILRPSWEPVLKALSAALNRDVGAGCEIRPVRIDPPPADAADQAVPHLNAASVEELCEQIFSWRIPVFAMSEGDARMLLDEPLVLDALNRLTEWGYPILVLGEACKPFAEHGFLPACLATLTDVCHSAGLAATVTYRTAADSAARPLRGRLLAPASADGQPSLLTLHLPDSTRIPDGFTGRDNKVLGLLNGLDTVLLPLLRGKRFDL